MLYQLKGTTKGQGHLSKTIFATRKRGHAWGQCVSSFFFLNWFVGSFKIRGVANQMANLPPEVKNGTRKLITMSAGNYGKAFAYTLNKLNLPGLCLMPLTAPSNRITLIKVNIINDHL